MSVFEILYKYRLEFLLGIWMTLKMCLIIWPIGIAAGSLLGIAGAKWRRTIGAPSVALSFALSAIPVLVVMFWLHYPLQSILDIVVDPFYTAVGCLSFINTILVADTVRGVLIDFPSQYLMASRVYGLSTKTTFWKVQLPIALRQLMPTILLIQITMLQATLFASLISVDEIFRVAQRINSMVYKPVEIYSALAVLYLFVCLPLHLLAAYMKWRFTRNLSER